MFRRILIPLDGSLAAERALKPALAIGGTERDEVLLLRVPVYKRAVSPSAAGYGWIIADQDQGQRQDEIREYLSGVADRYHHSSSNVQLFVESGDAASTIVDLALREQIDLIVLTTHGYSGFTRWMLGSVTERVLHSAPCPVLVIRGGGLLERMLICLDGSRLSEQILRPAVEIAQRLGSQITLLRVDHEEKLSSLERGLLEMADSELCKEMEKHPEMRLTYYLECIAAQFEERGLKIDKVVIKGTPAQAILDFTENQQMDLVAMATHGYSGLRRWVYGSVTEKVMRKAASAMLIVRPPSDVLN